MASDWKARLMPLIEFFERLHHRYPWAVPTASFLAGALSFALINRGPAMARLIALMALVGWPWLLISPIVRRHIEARLGAGVMAEAAVNFVSQSLQQELLFFALPFLIGALQWDIGQIAFTLAVAASAILSALDAWYARWIGDHPGRSLAFHAWCSLIAAMVAMPMLVHVSLEKALPISLALVGIWLLIAVPLMLRQIPYPGERMLWLVAMFIAPIALWQMRQHIPAAGLRVTQARMTQSLEKLVPGNEVKHLTRQQLQHGVIAFVAINAPMGVSQNLFFEWRTPRGQIERIPASIRGGSEKGWRTYTIKHNFPSDPDGRWHVDLVTPQGQLLKRMSFVVDASAPQPMLAQPESG